MAIQPRKLSAVLSSRAGWCRVFFYVLKHLSTMLRGRQTLAG